MKIRIVKDATLHERILEEQEKDRARKEEKQRLQKERVREAVKQNQEKMQELDEYLKQLDDYANKIVIAENTDAAKELYAEAMSVYGDAMQFLEKNKGARKFIADKPYAKLIEKVNALENAMHGKYESNHKEIDVATELVSLVTNAKRYGGTNKEKIDSIINALNHDYDYELLPRSEVRRLKRILMSIDSSIASKIKDSVCDARQIDVVKATNRCMINKRNEPNYLGCNAYMRDMSRDGDTATKDVFVELGFSEDPQNPDAIVNDLKDALLAVYDKVDDARFEVKHLKSGQHEIKANFTCTENAKSEQKVAARNEEEEKQRLKEQQEELRKKQAELEKQREQAKIDRESVTQFNALMNKLAKCKDQDLLDSIFDTVEDMHEASKLSDAQFEELLKIYNEAEERIKAGIPDKDDSLFMRVKYDRQIAKSQSGEDLRRIRQFVEQNFNEGSMNNATYEYLKSKLAARQAKLVSFGDSTEQVRVLDIKPKKNETKEEFIARFMKATKEEYPDTKQRLAVAYSYWDKR